MEIVSKKDKWLQKTEALHVLKGLDTDSLAYRITQSKLQCRESNLKSTMDIWRGTKLINFRVRAGGVGTEATPGMEVVAGASGRPHCGEGLCQICALH